MIKAVKVTANDDYNIVVTLENGRVIRMDMNFIHGQSGPIVEPLKQLVEFKKAFVRNGIVTWPSGFDIDPYYLVEQGLAVDQSA